MLFYVIFLKIDGYVIEKGDIENVLIRNLIIFSNGR